MHIFFSVGEPSGDQHAACLIEELRTRCPHLKATGYGGPAMRKAGCHINFELTNLAVMGFIRVVPLLWQFIRLVGDAKRYFAESRPDAVVLVDFPGFNWWIARKAKAAGIPVFYYLPPQLWAWAPWRIRRMRKFVDHILCGLPFEKAWYAERGMKVEYVGHPFFDEVAKYPLDQEFCDSWTDGADRIVGVLPGSRNHEISRNWPLMIEVMQRLSAQHQNIRFLVACYKERHQSHCRQMLEDQGATLPIEFCVGKTPEIIETAECCLMVSGSVSLEFLARKTPAVVIYRVSRLFYALIRPLVTLKSITLPNLIAGRVVLPEWIVVWFAKRDVKAITGVLDRWLSDKQAMQAAVDDLSQLRDELIETGASAQTAEAILGRLDTSAAQQAA